MTERTYWYKDAVFYRFQAKDEEGGEQTLRDIINKLKYVRSLNVTAVWLPVVVSRGSFYSIDPAWGGNQAFGQLLQAVHKSGMRLIMDLNFQHTDTDHPWFAQSCRGEKPFKDFYYWQDARTNGTLPNNWDDLYGGKAWTYQEERRSYYLHLMGETQPDLNLYSPFLRAELKKIMKFWLEKGVDGFALQDVSFISKPKKMSNGFSLLKGRRGLGKYTHGPREHEILSELRTAVRPYDALLIGDLDFTGARSALEFLTAGEDGELDLVRVPRTSADAMLFKKDRLSGLGLLIRKWIGRRWRRVLNDRAPQILQVQREAPAYPLQKQLSLPEGIRESLCCAYVFRRGVPVILQGTEVRAGEDSETDEYSLLNFYRDALYYRATLPAADYGSFRQYLPLSRELFVYERRCKTQKLLVICSATSKAVRFKAPKGFDLRKGQLILCSHTDYTESNGFVTQPYECRVYLF